MTLTVRFWGVRGSIACPSRDFVEYGGNTSCVEVDLDGRKVVLDAGTGIRPLGRRFIQEDVREAYILLTHCHWDHINGFPFFAPAYDRQRRFRVMAGHLRGANSILSVLSSQMTNPMFPIPLATMQSRMSFEDFEAGDVLDLYPGVRVRTAPLNHPNGATGYRLEYEGRSVCYVTDTEHVPGRLDDNVLDLIRDADAVIYDSTYTEAEFPAKTGWGHSTWNEGMRLCREANAKKMFIFHHEPDHDDAFMAKLEAEAKAAWDGIEVAREGMEAVID